VCVKKKRHDFKAKIRHQSRWLLRLPLTPCYNHNRTMTSIQLEVNLASAIYLFV